MYFQPYGDDQQLNLNWIINEIINLHKQLDPDYETPSFTQIYPYSNLNRLNLDWILSELKALKELAPEPAPPLDIQAVAEALVALPFDSNTSYQIYDFISRDGEIWRATEAIPAGGVWDSSKWFKTKIGADLAVLERWINTINNSLTAEIQARQDADTALRNTISDELENVKDAIGNVFDAGADPHDDCNNFVEGLVKYGPNTLNIPEPGYGILFGYVAQYKTWKWQIAVTTRKPSKPNIFKRCNINDGGWDDWLRIADEDDISALSGSINSINAEVKDDSPASVNGVYIRYRIRHNILYFSIMGTPTATDTVEFTLPRALATGIYISTPQWGNTNNIMQVFGDANQTWIRMRNFTINRSVNVSGVVPLVIS